MGIVRNVPVEWALEEVVSSLVVPEGFGAVVRARRLNRKTTDNNATVWIPTPTVVLTFNGQKLPDRVFCYFTSLPVQTYILPTIQCNKCCRFGHIASQCRSKERCFICAQPHAGINCSNPSVPPTCLLCSGNHKATDSNCPEHARQRAIKLVMSQENISYSEASVRFPQVRKSFADVSRSQFSPSTIAVQIPHTSAQSPSYVQNYPNSVSYRQTHFTQKTPPAPASTSGYDKQSHNTIIRSPPSSLPNGSAYPSENMTANDNLLDLLLSTILNIISRFDDSQLPNNVVSKLSQILNSIQNAKHPSMELSQHSP
ncbi:uncharacterized protein LOC133320662 [Danaus plexippus]|uniref:uncharacterized protein LOC133320662 n=1 Tax=Danaus plexippus TaxID=13037 RepID=UPI002AB02795|nr:uncharacterized protein LOC133320662 [Danaus plexippus]